MQIWVWYYMAVLVLNIKYENQRKTRSWWIVYDMWSTVNNRLVKKSRAIIKVNHITISYGNNTKLIGNYKRAKQQFVTILTTNKLSTSEALHYCKTGMRLDQSQGIWILIGHDTSGRYYIYANGAVRSFYLHSTSILIKLLSSTPWERKLPWEYLLKHLTAECDLSAKQTDMDRYITITERGGSP